jgi:hypothetical protein
MPKDRSEPNASELLGDWRAAERDTVAAKVAQTVAELALKAASAAEEAAKETEKAALAALDAARSAQAAAAQAKKAAMQASEASTLLTVGAEGDKARANQSLVQAEEAEAAARDRFHEAESKGFPKQP